MELSKLKVMVTGGAGFIGSHLVDRLIETENQVIVYDSFDEYYQGKEKNVRQHLSDSNFTLIRASILESEILLKAVQGVDIIFHLAAQPGVRFSLENPAKTNHVNTCGTINVLRAAVQARVKKVVFASSSSVYGIPKYMPIDEEHPTEPISIYGASKLAGEVCCRIFCKLWGLPVVMLRYHTVYGPRQRPDMAIRRWTELLLRNDAPVIYGDGNQTRDFTYVSDIVEGTLLAAEVDGLGGQVFNLGGGSRVSVNDVVRNIIELTGKRNVRPLYQSPNAGDVPDTHAEIKKAKQILGYDPKVTLKEGLRNFVKWLAESK